MQFPKAHAMGYFLSPFGLDAGEKSQWQRLKTRGL
jgi:hypothetical protein